MNIGNIILLASALLLPSLASCQDKAKMKFSVLVVDDEGNPVPNCEAGAIIFDKSTNTRSGYKRTGKMTDANGIASFELSSSHSRVSCGAKAPEGYYRSYGGEFFFKDPISGVWQPENKQFKVVLNKIKNPIAMYAVSVGMNGKVEIPAIGKPCGFDLMVSDWVAPHGKGKVSDLVFHFTKEERSRRDYDAKLTITCSNKGDGFVGIKAPFEKDQKSQLVMPYEAPKQGYQSKIVKITHAKPGTATIAGYDKNQHYFLRVRTVLDKKGNVVSALYGKIQGDIQFWRSKVTRFTHYLNPTPNDRNVEFDPKKNLIDTGHRGHKVQSP